MAAGRPVAAFDVGGLPELITHEQTGLLAPPGDALALVGAIRRLLDDQYLYEVVSSNAQIFVRKFSISTHVENLIEIYRQVLRTSVGQN